MNGPHEEVHWRADKADLKSTQTRRFRQMLRGSHIKI